MLQDRVSRRRHVKRSTRTRCLTFAPADGGTQLQPCCETAFAPLELEEKEVGVKAKMLQSFHETCMRGFMLPETRPRCPGMLEKGARLD